MGLSRMPDKTYGSARVFIDSIYQTEEQLKRKRNIHYLQEFQDITPVSTEVNVTEIEEVPSPHSTNRA